ncbi:MAG: hypothetical protein BRC22_02005, partial [Parcubacteria group bacterium QH_9_35_7]
MPKQTQSKTSTNLPSPLSYFLITTLTSILLLGALYFFTDTNTTTAQSQPPATINYQGKLLENNASVTTSKQMGFVLYDSDAGGNRLYTASGTLTNTSTINVTPTQGIFNVELGAGNTNSLDPQIFQNNSSVYLQVYIEGTKLTPRKRLTSQPFSLNTQYLMGYEPNESPTTTNYIPVSDGEGGFTFKRATVNETTTLANNEGKVGIGTASPT